MAIGWLIPEGRRYANWSNPSSVIQRSERFFREGRPYSPVLKGNVNFLNEIITIRNAIAHKTSSTREKFVTVVRHKLMTYPAKLTVGGFLAMTIPRSSPPGSFLEHYLAKIEFLGRRIVPS